MSISSKYLVSILGLIASAIWLAVSSMPSNNLRVIACDVGQGDGFLIIKGTTQILVDAGPSETKMVDCLGRYMPFWDHTIEMAILTNPDKDHYFGFISVAQRYSINLFVATPVQKEGEDYKALVDAIADHNISIANPLTGTAMKLSDIEIDFVWPRASDISTEYIASGGKSGVLGAVATTKSPNALSLVFNLKYKNFKALFTGDIEPDETETLLQTGKISDVDYLKVPHHGSKNGLTKELLQASSPGVAVISVGKDNRYGHPSSEVIQMLSEAGIKTFRTDQVGDVLIESDGESVFLP